MRLAPLYRNALLLTGLLFSGIAAVQAADWPRQITDSRGTHTLESQ
ncbi:Fe2+-enterobactin ABC transporter substrate-binding protein, partial [Escherichia coli O157:H7]